MGAEAVQSLLAEIDLDELAAKTALGDRYDQRPAAQEGDQATERGRGVPQVWQSP